MGFMSFWDRQAVLNRYSALFDEAEDENALMEELGTPTKLAVELARTYVPSAPPSKVEEPAPLEEVPEQICLDLSQETPAEEAPKTVRSVSRGALVAYLIPAILIGLPITVALVCLGLPFLAAGAAVIAAAVKETLTIIAALSLVSDILLAIGAALALCAVGLMLCCFGLWISMELCWLWVGKTVVALGRKLCVKEVPAA